MEGLREHGYVPGRNIRIEDRYLVEGYDALGTAARKLVAEKPDLILTFGATSAIAASKATTTIPIVMVSGGEPVALGLVKSLARPGGNVTGLTTFNVDLSGKRIELLKEAFPATRRVAVVLYPGSQVEVASYANYETAGRAFGVEIRKVEVRTASEIRAVVGAISTEEADAVAFVGSTLLRANTEQLVAAVSKARLPAIYVDSSFADSGGLMSYGSSISDNFKRSAAYVDRILKGANPADLAIEQPTRVELVVNIKAAEAQGIAIPRAVVQRADRVVQ